MDLLRRSWLELGSGMPLEKCSWMLLKFISRSLWIKMRKWLRNWRNRFKRMFRMEGVRLLRNKKLKIRKRKAILDKILRKKFNWKGRRLNHQILNWKVEMKIFKTQKKAYKSLKQKYLSSLKEAQYQTENPLPFKTQA